MKNFIRKMTHVALCALCLVIPNIAAMQQGMGPDDPLLGIDYRLAFDQKEIYKNNQDLVQYWGCNNNVDSAPRSALPAELSDHADYAEQVVRDQTRCCPKWCCLWPWRNAQRSVDYQPLPANADSENQLRNDEEYRSARIDAYIKTCLDQLEKARKKIIMRPARRAGVSLGLDAVSLATIVPTIGATSLGGSFAIMGSLHNGAYAIRNIVEAYATKYDRPAHPLTQLEELFAITKCFIPNKLWAPIAAKFALARVSKDMAQMQCINFIEFALTLTCAQHKEHQAEPNPEDIRERKKKMFEIIERLESRIDNFFKDYLPAQEQVATIKFAIRCFVDNLINNQDLGQPRANARYQFLIGSQGIGKTKFVVELNKWLQEEMPGIVYYRNCSAHDSAELEGGPTQRGLFLEILSSQLKEKRTGALVLLDEPDWIDKMGGVARDAKRTFNGDLAEVSTKYFGPDALLLPLPPMLIFVNSNSPITDDALEKRFDNVRFPKPTLDSLIKYALERFRTNELYDSAQQPDQSSRVAEVDEFLRRTVTAGYGSRFTSFRDIENGSELWNQVLLLLEKPPKIVPHTLGGSKTLPKELEKYAKK